MLSNECKTFFPISRLYIPTVYKWAPFASVFRDLFATVDLVPKDWSKRSQLTRLLISRKTRLKILELLNRPHGLKIWQFSIKYAGSLGRLSHQRVPSSIGVWWPSTWFVKSNSWNIIIGSYFFEMYLGVDELSSNRPW